ncbi:MAG: hypothetical protein MK085_08905 [Phycisphaerales bacterium]|nr:hypothetical protein [Phycisphaerales bacterium]
MVALACFKSRLMPRCGLCVVLWVLVGCGAPTPKDPGKVLADTNASIGRHKAALTMLEGQGDQARTVRALKHMLAADGYGQATRVLAYERLWILDQDALQQLLEIRLPRTNRLAWRRWVSERIASDKWLAMTPTLIRAWARPIPGWLDRSEQRPEREALVAMYGEEGIPKVLFQVMLDSNPATAANLRARCWELLVAEGRQDQLRTLLAEAEAHPRDGMIQDLSRLASGVGVVPRNREEVLWARALCLPENREFLAEAEVAVSGLSQAKREQLEIRDLAMVVAASRHQPELLVADDDELYRLLDSHVRSRKRRIPSANFEGWGQHHSESLHDARKRITWGDLVGMLVIVEALQVPQVLDHIFDFAERDLQDRSTEFGGVLALDDQGRFELLEFAPRVRRSDKRFEAPQAMFDRAYTALAHFHNHAQSYENGQFAGPHMGDFTYAMNTRANCLVFTFLDSRTIDVDFYRHGNFVVDLGTIRRPS